MPAYPTAAYSPSGQLWWKLTLWPGKRQKFGAEPRLASWLMFNAKVGDILTMRRLRSVLADDSGPNTDEHLNRRFRELRKFGWCVLSSRDSSDLRPDEYRLDRIGDPIWLGKSQYGKKAPSAKVRREVFDSDGHRCVICGIGSGEAYPDEPNRKARLTLGHHVASALYGRNAPANLRTECSRCNEPAREEATRSASAAEIWPKMRSLGRTDKSRLLSWMERGQRDRDAVDRLYDDYRSLPAQQRNELRAKLMQAVKGSKPPANS